MAYGFALDASFGGSGKKVTIVETHNGEGVGKEVIFINGRAISALSGEELRTLLDATREKREEITFILRGSRPLVFKPNDAPDHGKWKPAITQNTFNLTHPDVKTELEYDGKKLVRTNSLRIGAILDAFCNK